MRYILLTSPQQIRSKKRCLDHRCLGHRLYRTALSLSHSVNSIARPDKLNRLSNLPQHHHIKNTTPPARCLLRQLSPASRSFQSRSSFRSGDMRQLLALSCSLMTTILWKTSVVCSPGAARAAAYSKDSFEKPSVRTSTCSKSGQTGGDPRWCALDVLHFYTRAVYLARSCGRPG